MAGLVRVALDFRRGGEGWVAAMSCVARVAAARAHGGGKDGCSVDGYDEDGGGEHTTISVQPVRSRCYQTTVVATVSALTG